MKNRHERNKSLQLNERAHDHGNGDDNNGVPLPSEENGHSPQPFLPINNNRKRYKFKRPNKYYSVNEIMQRTCPLPPPPPPPPPPSSAYSNDDDNGVGLAEDETRVKPSGTINVETFSFKWEKTDKRGRESRVRDCSPEIIEPVVSQLAVGYKSGLPLKKLLYERYKAEVAAMEKDRERSGSARPP